VRGSFLVLGAVLLAAEPAAAFCKATTCDPATGATCPVDANGCATTGAVVSWPRRCVSFGVQQDGSAKRGISYEKFDAIVRTALQQWLAVDCGGGQKPSISLWDMGDTDGPIVCDKPEYNQTAPNANAWILQDGDWPYTDPGSEFAHTRVTHDASTGHILDADVEINSSGVALTTDDDAIVADLQSIATHEAGHFLGLSNSSDPEATLSASYSPASRSARSLSADDKAGICSLYPPDRDAPACDHPSPNHGFSRYCAGATHPPGCSVTSPPGRRGEPVALAALALCAARMRRRRAARDRP
jgi:MYXO-CTERM domain-containing protein